MVTHDRDSIPSPRASRWALVALLLITAATYGRALGGGFLWDDHGLIVDNRYVQDWRYLGRNLTHEFWDTSDSQPQRWKQGRYYRPVVTLSYQLDYQLHGLGPMGYHLSNVLLHLLAVWLAWVLCRRLAPESLLVAFIGAGIFALHPSRAEPVCWISGRTDVLMGLCVLASLLAFDGALRARGRRLWLWLSLGWLAFAAALGSKEVGVCVALLLPALDLLGRRSPEPLRRRNWLLVHGPLIPAALAFVMLAMAREGGLGGGGGGLERLGVTLASVSYYAEFVIAPYDPNALVGQFLNLGAASAGRLAVGAATLLSGGALVVLCWRRAPLVSFGLLLAGICIAPVLNIVALPAAAPVAERFVYLPLFGLALALGAGLSAAPLAPKVKTLVVASLALMALSWATVVVLRSGDFASPLRFWKVAAAQNPGHPTAHRALARLRAQQGKHGASARHLALAERNAKVRGLTAVGQSLLFARLAAASDRVLDADREADELAEACQQIAAGELRQASLALFGERFVIDGDAARALRRFYGAELREVAGRLHSRLARDEVALRLLREATRRQPERVSAWTNLALALARAGRLSDARRALARALRLNPSSKRSRGLAKLLATLPSGAIGAAPAQRWLRLRAPGRAAAHFRRLLAQSPEQRALWSGLFLAHGAAGDLAGLQRSVARARRRFGDEAGLMRAAQRGQRQLLAAYRRVGRSPPSPR